MRFDADDTLAFRPADEIRREQERLLNEHLRYCREHSPFYAALPKGPVTLEGLAELPTTGKRDVAERNADFLAVPERELSDICFTSGTTGRPCRIAYTQGDLERLAANDAAGFLAAGMREDDVVLTTCTIDRCFVAGLAYYSGVVRRGAAAIRNGLNTLESHAEIFRNNRVTGIVGVPSFLAKLGALLQRERIDASAVRCVVCIGEPLRTRELTLTPLGERLEGYWPGAVHSTYASTEIATSFTECGARSGGHAPAELAIVEIVDDAGRPVPDGETGEVCVTPLGVTGMPLVRFRTGDVSFKIPGPCSCGRNTPRLGPILGRKAQMLKVRGTTLFPALFFNALDAVAGVEDYYMEVSGSALSDEIDLHVALREGTLESNRVAETLYARTRIHVRIHADPPEEVRRRVFGTSRKPVRFFDLRKD